MGFERIVAAVPTNIITGFLGVGKTSAILNLLKQKPGHERWAVLVNEFGEVGIDGSLMRGQYSEEKGVYVKEVPGGCMCCSANLPMQIALNQLLAKANPHRLIIEPTGLGHPKEVIEILSEPHYHDVISLQKTITLVDARKLCDKRYTEHDTFNQQIDIADLILANKQALYSDADRNALRGYIKQRKGDTFTTLFTDFGEIAVNTLEGKTQISQRWGHITGQTKFPLPDTRDAPDVPFPENGILKSENNGEGYRSVGWQFDARYSFRRKAFRDWAVTFKSSRIKAVVITDEGVLGLNIEGDEMTEMFLDDCTESRIEIIAPQTDDCREQRLLDCIKA